MAIEQKYSVGTKIKFIYPYADTDKTGLIVGYLPENILVFLPDGSREPKTKYGVTYTWICRWKDLEILAQPGEQLLFEFMNEK